MNKYRKHFLTFVISLLVLVALTGCNTSSGESKKDTTTTVQIAINGGINPLVIGKEKGWFEEEFTKHHAKIKWSEFPSGPPLLESLASNRVDLSFLGDGALIAGLEKKLPFEVIAQTSEGKSSVRILAQANGKIKTIEDLKGKTVGVASGTTGHVYLIKALKLHGLSKDDIKIINLQPDDAQAAFESKKLDAWATWNPYIINNVAKRNAIELSVKGEILAPGGIITRTAFGEEHPELVEAYLKIYKKSVDWQLAHLEEASEIYAKKTKLPAKTIQKILTAEPPNMLFTKEGIQAQQDSIDTLAKVGYINKSFSFEKSINHKYIDAAFKK